MVAHNQAESVTKSMDQAMQALLAVFTSNVLCNIPLIISLFLHDKLSDNVGVIIEVIFLTQHMTDPLIYICINHDYRGKMCALFKACWSRITQCVLQMRATASPPHQEQQVSHTHMQETPL